MQSTAYVVVTYLGQNALTGQVAQFYGKYVDEWVRQGRDRRDGWRIRRRVLTLFVSHFESL